MFKQTELFSKIMHISVWQARRNLEAVARQPNIKAPLVYRTKTDGTGKWKDAK